jgi:hypothetical protein
VNFWGWLASLSCTSACLVQVGFIIGVMAMGTLVANARARERDSADLGEE